MPDHDRPRERLLALGADALSDAELLAIVLRTGMHGQSVLDLARRVLSHFQGSLNDIAGAKVPDLLRIRGVGTAKAAEICAAFALAKRMAAREHHAESPPLTEPGAVYRLMREQVRNVPQEEFLALLLDTRNHLLQIAPITVGLVDRTQIHPREVFREAIRRNCSRMVLVHNHPSGDPTPSAQDIAATRQLVEAGRIVGIEVLDHVVIGDPARSESVAFTSLRQEGLF